MIVDDLYYKFCEEFKELLKNFRKEDFDVVCANL